MLPNLSLFELVRYMLSAKHDKIHIAEYFIELLGIENILKTSRAVGFDLTGIHYPVSFQIFFADIGLH